MTRRRCYVAAPQFLCERHDIGFRARLFQLPHVVLRASELATAVHEKHEVSPHTVWTLTSCFCIRRLDVQCELAVLCIAGCVLHRDSTLDILYV